MPSSLNETGRRLPAAVVVNLIHAGNYHDVCFEELERDPVAEVDDQIPLAR